MTDRCRHAARVGDVLLPCTIASDVHEFTARGPEGGRAAVHRYAGGLEENHAVWWHDGDVWDVVQPDPPLEDDAREEALTLLRKKGIREWYPAVQTLHKAGLLAQNAPSASAQQRAYEVIRESDDVRCKHGDLCGDHVAHDVVDLLTEAGVLNEPCRHVPLTRHHAVEVTFDLTGNAVADDGHGNQHRLFVEAEQTKQEGGP